MGGCTNGSEPRPGAPSAIEIRWRDILSLSKIKREDLSYAGGGLITAFDILSFCQSSPESSYQPATGLKDGLIRAFNGVVDEKWSANCQCKKPPLPPGGLPGGQCPVRYHVRIDYQYDDYQSPYEGRFGGFEGGGFGPIRARVDILHSDATRDTARVRCEDALGNFLFGGEATQTAKPGTFTYRYTIRREDGLPDDCGIQRDPDPPPIRLPDNYVFLPLDEFPPCPPCECPPPGTLFIPTPIPIPPIIIPIPIPIPIPFPLPPPLPLPTPDPLPIPCPPCDCPPPPPPKPPTPPKDMDCCPELISRLSRLQGDVTQVREVQLPKIKEHFDDRIDGVIECLDFKSGTDASQNALGSSITGTSVLSNRAIAVSLQAITPTPANRSLRQDGGNTPDVIQGGWCWFKYAGGVSTRIPLDSERKFIPIPIEYRKLKSVSFVWRGVHDIAYSVLEHLPPEPSPPPYDDRPCKP